MKKVLAFMLAMALAFSMATTALADYVVSDKPLTTVSDTETPVEESNPETGAENMLGLTAALAAVSLAGIFVAKRK